MAEGKHARVDSGTMGGYSAPVSFLGELRRRGVLGAVTAYGVVAAGGLQVADIVAHGMDLPSWTMRVLIWGAALGLPVTGLISWFYDLTSRGFIRTEAPTERASPALHSPADPSPRPATPAPITHPQSGPAGATLAAIGPGFLLAGGRYKIERELGTGGMGRVLAATDTRLGRRVAIKVVTGAHEPARVRRFEQEARTAGSLEHPNVVQVYDLGEQDGVPFLVTELLDGHTLRSIIKDGPLPWDQVQNLALQLARGLAAAHARGVVHRDLKPENLFLTKDGRLKILDFGLAKLTGADEGSVEHGGLTVTGAIFGTPGYLSPEQARGERAGPPSDVFSAGCVLYELLSGKRAFPGASLIEAGHAALVARPATLPPTAPAGLVAVVDHALAKEPAARYADGGALVAALESLGPGAATLPAAPGRRSMMRTSGTVALMGASLALVAALASAIVVRRRTAPTVVRTGTDRPERLGRGRNALPPVPPGDFGAVPAPPAAPAEPAVPAVPGFDAQKFEQQMHRVQLRAEASGRLGVMQGARALERAKEPAQAEEMLARQVERRPDDVHARLMLWGVQARQGRTADAERELAKWVEGLDDDDDDWPLPIARAYAGKLSDAQVFSAAKEEGDDERGTRSRLAEAYYYLGMFHLLKAPKPDKDTARTYFQEATKQRTNDVEIGFAGEELAALR